MNQGAGRRVLMKKTACKKSHATVPLTRVKSNNVEFWPGQRVTGPKPVCGEIFHSPPVTVCVTRLTRAGINQFVL